MTKPAGNYAEIGRLSRPFRAFAVDGPTAAAFLWAVLFLHEPVTLGLFAGLGVILLSVWLVLGEKRGEAA